MRDAFSGGIPDRGRRLLDRDDPVHGVGEEYGERPYARVGVDDQLPAGKIQRLAHKLRQSLRLLGVDLKERRRSYAERPT